MKKFLARMKKNNKGFTLVELIIVIAILGVLMAVMVPQYIKYVDKAKAGTDMAALGEILHAAEIDAALGGEDVTYTFTGATANGTIGIPTDLQSTLGTSVQLKSSEGKKIKGADLSIKVTVDDGKAGWTTDQKTTETQFSDIKNLAG